MEDTTVRDLVDEQIRQQGTGCVQVKDGHIFTFTRETIERLLVNALESAEGRVIVFVRHGAVS